MQIAESLKPPSPKQADFSSEPETTPENIHLRAGNKVSADVLGGDSWGRLETKAEFASLLCKGRVNLRVPARVTD